MAAAIDYVKLKSGSWIEGTDSPDDMLGQAALRMAEMMAQRPTATPAELQARPDVRPADVRPPASVRHRLMAATSRARSSFRPG